MPGPRQKPLALQARVRERSHELGLVGNQLSACVLTDVDQRQQVGQNRLGSPVLVGPIGVEAVEASASRDVGQ